jgi:hypothetical protein
MIIGARLARGDEVIEQSGDFRSWPEGDLKLATSERLIAA